MAGLYNNKNKGIYRIINIKNNNSYIGSTIQGFSKRWSDHKTELLRNIHTNPYLQNAWNKYGEESFIFIVHEIINNASINKIRDREQYWIDNLNPKYNLSKVSHYGEISELGKFNYMYKRGTKAYFISPDGVHYCAFSIKGFAEQFKLNATSLQDLCNGKLHNCKGWKGSIITNEGSTPYLYTFKSKQKYTLTKPDGIKLCTYDLKHTCNEFNLSYSTMASVGNGRKKQYKGWKASMDINN